MADKFVDYETRLCANWCNTVDWAVFDALGEPQTPDAARINIGAMPISPDDTEYYVANAQGWAEVNPNQLVIPSYQRTEADYVAAAAQDEFVVPGIAPEFVEVYLDGLNLILGIDYQMLTESTVQLTTPATGGENVKVVGFGVIGAAGDSVHFVSIDDYGAVGDGATDNQSAIQDALDAAEDQPWALYIPAGEYYLAGPVVINANTRIYAQPGSWLVRDYDGGDPLVSTAEDNVAISGVLGVKDSAWGTNGGELFSAHKASGYCDNLQIETLVAKDHSGAPAIELKVSNSRIGDLRIDCVTGASTDLGVLINGAIGDTVIHSVSGHTGGNLCHAMLGSGGGDTDQESTSDLHIGSISGTSNAGSAFTIRCYSDAPVGETISRVTVGSVTGYVAGSGLRMYDDTDGGLISGVTVGEVKLTTFDNPTVGGNTIDLLNTVDVCLGPVHLVEEGFIRALPQISVVGCLNTKIGEILAVGYEGTVSQIIVEDSVSTIFGGGWLKAATHGGVYINDGASNTTMSGMNIETGSTGKAGIYIEDSNSCTIVGNTIDCAASANPGIRVVGTSTSNIVKANHVKRYLYPTAFVIPAGNLNSVNTTSADFV